jgi:Protein of unknown function (DUF2924)/Protein of unknown function (DUF3489)
MLTKDKGATLAALVEATGWMPHTTRAAMTGLRKRGFEIERTRHEKLGSLYRIVGDQTAPVGLDPRIRKLLVAREKGLSARHVKVGSIVVREYQGKLHEVLVVPGGFCWQGQVFASLSTIARKITGTSWNGPRFFGLRGKD